MRAAEARKACPDIRLVHVQTIGDGATEANGADEPISGPGVEDEAGRKASRLKEKACLERYRQ
eukprot:scaffold650585_cov48-Prasinocladus_malaysianus.AAC.1